MDKVALSSLHANAVRRTSVKHALSEIVKYVKSNFTSFFHSHPPYTGSHFTIVRFHYHPFHQHCKHWNFPIFHSTHPWSTTSYTSDSICITGTTYKGKATSFIKMRGKKKRTRKTPSALDLDSQKSRTVLSQPIPVAKLIFEFS